MVNKPLNTALFLVFVGGGVGWPVMISRSWFQIFFLFSPRCLGKWSNLTNSLQMGWNHQLAIYLQSISMNLLDITLLSLRVMVIWGYDCTNPDNSLYTPTHNSWKKIHHISRESLGGTFRDFVNVQPPFFTHEDETSLNKCAFFTQISWLGNHQQVSTPSFLLAGWWKSGWTQGLIFSREKMPCESERIFNPGCSRPAGRPNRSQQLGRVHRGLYYTPLGPKTMKNEGLKPPIYGL